MISIFQPTYGGTFLSSYQRKNSKNHILQRLDFKRHLSTRTDKGERQFWLKLYEKWNPVIRINLHCSCGSNEALVKLAVYVCVYASVISLILFFLSLFLGVFLCKLWTHHLLSKLWYLCIMCLSTRNQFKSCSVNASCVC